MTIEARRYRPNNRRSVRNPDHCASWREKRTAEGWQFVQFWTKPEIAEKLQQLIAADGGTDVKPKDVIEGLIMKEPT